MAETKIEVRTADGVADCYAFTPSGTGPWPAVLYFMDGLGIRPALKQMAEHLASKGYFVFMPNMFYRSGAFAPFNPQNVWTDQGERDRLMAMIKKVDAANAMKDVTAFLDAIAKNPNARPGKIATMGYCLGGRLAFTTAGSFPDRIAAAASIHGGGLVTEEADSPHKLSDKVQAKLYFGVADNDRSCTPEQQATLKAALDAAKVRYRLELYPGAQHGFAVSDMPPYNATAAQQHWDRALALFSETLPKN
jgi:carboxymethylenebutenolidase